MKSKVKLNVNDVQYLLVESDDNTFDHQDI